MVNCVLCGHLHVQYDYSVHCKCHLLAFYLCHPGTNTISVIWGGDVSWLWWTVQSVWLCSSLLHFGVLGCTVGWQFCNSLVLATGGPELLLKWFPDVRLLFISISAISGVLGSAAFMVIRNCKFLFNVAVGSLFSSQRKIWLCETSPGASYCGYENLISTLKLSGIRACLLENKPYVIMLIVFTFQNSAPWVIDMFWP